MTDNQLQVFTLHDHNFNPDSPFQKKHFPRKQSLQHHIAGYHELSQLLALTSPDNQRTTHLIEEFITRQDLQLVFAFRVFANEQHIQIEEFTTRQDQQVVFTFVFFLFVFVFCFVFFGFSSKHRKRKSLESSSMSQLIPHLEFVEVFPTFDTNFYWLTWTNHFTANSSSSFKLVKAIACYKWHL